MTISDINSAWLIIDAGGTYLKSAILRTDGTICASSYFSTPSFSHSSLERIRHAFAEVLLHGKDYCKREQLSLCGLGISIPGPFDYQQGIPLMRHKYQQLYGMDMKRMLESIDYDCSLPIWFMHDVNAVLAGELWKGDISSYKNVAVVTLGTGLGVACSLDGVIQQTELGSPLFSLYNYPCQEGILEDYVSQRGILRVYHRLKEGLQEDITVKEIAELAQQGDEAALHTFREVANILAEGLYAFVKEKKIECLLFGGQISRSFFLMKDTLQAGLSDITTLKAIRTVSSIDAAALWGCLSVKINR